MEIDPPSSDEMKTLDKSVDLGDIFDKNCKSSDKDATGIVESDQSLHSSEPKLKRRKKKNRCPVDGCGKKLGLLDIVCKCEQKFCMKHRHPEAHSCNYDFKSEGRKQLEKENKCVLGVKIEKI